MSDNDSTKTNQLPDIHAACVAAVNAMVANDVERHISYISPQDPIEFGLKHGGRIPKVTIEWVDESECVDFYAIDRAVSR